MPLADDSIGLITPLLNVNSFYQLYLSREPYLIHPGNGKSSGCSCFAKY